MAGPFTAADVRALLSNEAAAAARWKVPASKAIAIVRLVGGLNWLHREVQNRITWRKELDLIDAAIRILTEVLPAHLGSYPDAFFPFHDIRTPAFRTLLDAARGARRAREKHLPFVPGPPKERWIEILDELRGIFRSALPTLKDAPNEVMYGFIAAVVPDITGEETTAGAVKKEILSGRRGKPRRKQAPSSSQ